MGKVPLPNIFPFDFPWFNFAYPYPLNLILMERLYTLPALSCCPGATSTIDHTPHNGIGILDLIGH